MVMLRCLALVVLLSASVYANGRYQVIGPQGPPYYWTVWEDHGECSVLCGTGLVLQKRYVMCNQNIGTCIPEDMPRVHSRKMICNRKPCGDICPPGKLKFVPHTHTDRFYQCVSGRAFLHHCPPKAVWDQALGRCVWMAL